MQPDKHAVREALLAALREDVGSLERLHGMALDEATGAESKAENKYDTRSLEASYLAAGQGARLLDLRQLLAAVEGWEVRPAGDAAAVFDLVAVGLNAPGAWLLLAPSGGGRRVRVAGADVLLVTPDAPLGRAVLGARADDEVEVTTGDVRVVWAVA